jgi:hypothetical protein
VADAMRNCSDNKYFCGNANFAPIKPARTIMKRVLLIVAVLLGVAFATASPAQAWWRRGLGGPGYPGAGYYGASYAPYYGATYSPYYGANYGAGYSPNYGANFGPYYGGSYGPRAYSYNGGYSPGYSYGPGVGIGVY